MNPEILKIKKKITNLESKLVKLRELCNHDSVDLKHDSNNGNYDPSDDSWWISGKCLDCGVYLYADIEESPELYRKFSAQIKQ